MKELSEYYDHVVQVGKKAQGRTELLNYLSGKKLTKAQAIKAYCYDCMGFYADGRQDCEMPTCPLYPFMPFRKGGVQKSRSISDKQKKEMSDRLKKARVRRGKN